MAIVPDFVWKGKEGAEDGVAVFTYDGTTIDLAVKDFRTAWRLANLMQDAWYGGIRAGMEELSKAVSSTLTEVSRRY